MTTVGYCVVSADGRAYADQLLARAELLPDLRRLVQAVHDQGAAVSVQLVHCGFFSSPGVIGRRPLGASRKLCLYRGAELHAGHGYLLSQFLSPWTNRRRDRYGGSLENRLRFPAEVVRRVRAAVGPDFPVLVKLNQRDGFPGGLELDEAVEVARGFQRAGASALVPSCGFTARRPLYPTFLTLFA